MVSNKVYKSKIRITLYWLVFTLKSIALLIKTIRRGAKKVKYFTKRGLNIIAIENYKNWLIGIIPVSYRLSVEDARK